VDPIEYLRIVQRRWALLLLLVVGAAIAAYITTPDNEKQRYEATHVLLIEGPTQGRGVGGGNVAVAALRATVGEVPRNVAESLDYPGGAARLLQNVEVSNDRTIGTVSITATDEDPDEAIRIADAFGAELIAYLEAEDAARADEATAAAAERAEALQTRITDLEALIAQNPANVAVLSAERDALVRQYSVVFEDQNEGVAPNRYSTIEAATAVRADEGRFAPPSSAGQRMLLAGLVALILGGALALFIDRADNRIRTRRHAEAAFGLPVIAEIPAISGRAGRRGVVVADNPGSQVAEAFRTLRTSAQLFARSGPTEADQPGLAGRRVFLVTSTDAGEGKSTTAANLAAAFAETGRSVLLIDWDLSRPALGHLMRTETSRGVADVLVPVAEAPALADLCVPTSVPGVWLLGAGTSTPHTANRVEWASRVLDEARRFADVVVVDTPPLLGSSITRELVTLAEAVIVVCRSGATGEGSASRASDLLSRLGAQVIGIALVGISASAMYDFYGSRGPRSSGDGGGAGSASTTSASGRT
jgi:Mrp family chromosome partitioning ATPase/capsular polysaccharide biosynthesis protein